jgi:hypothetical protein
MVHQTLLRRPRFIYKLKTKALQSIVPIEIVSLTCKKAQARLQIRKREDSAENRERPVHHKTAP